MSKVILFISAFVPMYILFLLNSIVWLILGHLEVNFVNLSTIIVLSILTLIGIAGVIIIINCKSKKEEEIKLLSKKNLTDQHFLNYFSLFVLLSLTFDLSKLSFICVFIVIMIFIGIVYIKNNIFYINPLLNIMGYSFYDVTYSDNNGKKKELRIFFKGELRLNCKYTICACNKNINILK